MPTIIQALVLLIHFCSFQVLNFTIPNVSARVQPEKQSQKKIYTRVLLKTDLHDYEAI